MKSYSVTIQMKATEQYFPLVLFISLCKVVLTFDSVDEILKCDHSNESYWAAISCGTVYYVVNSVCGQNPLWYHYWYQTSLIPLSCGTFMWTTMVFNFFARGREKGMGGGHLGRYSRPLMRKLFAWRAHPLWFIIHCLLAFMISLPGNIWKEWKLHTQH